MQEWGSMRTDVCRRRVGRAALVVITLALLYVMTAAPATSTAATGRHLVTSRNNALKAARLVLRVDPRRVVRTIPDGFLGLAIEYYKFMDYAGDDPGMVDPVLEQLIRNLSPGQPFDLRIGGDSTDWSWWPVPGMQTPPGVSYAITPAFIDTLRAVSQSVNARLILGINFRTDSKEVASKEAQSLLAGLAPRVEALELGNEPELYDTFGFDEGSNGAEFPASVPDWDFDSFEQGFTSIASALPAVPVAGPTTTKPWWDSELGTFLADEPEVRITTVHRYPLKDCWPPTAPVYPSRANVLSASASAEPAASVSPLVQVAHDHKAQLRVDEMNITPCPTQASLLRTSFATSLWALNSMFEMANAMVDGVNVDATTAGVDDLFTFEQSDGRWQAAVTPEYYGLLMFADAAPAGSRLLRLQQPASPRLHAWATQGPSGVVRVVIINDGYRAELVRVELPHAKVPGTLERLARGANHQGATLGGQTFGTSTGTGMLPGTRRLVVVEPQAQDYTFTAPALSAELLTIK